MPTSAKPTRQDRKRAEIIRLAQNLFFKEGYAGASMSQIAAAVGGSKTTLYNHFQSKEELLLAVVRDVVEPRPSDFDVATMPSEFRAWLAWYGRASVKKITSYNMVSLQRLAAAEALRFPEVGKTLYDAVMSPNILKVLDSFEAAMDARILRRADPRVAVGHFLEMCLGWTLRRVIWNIQPPPTDREIEKNVSDAVRAFMDGYALRTGKNKS